MGTHARTYRTILILGCLWAAATTAVWPMTSFSGAGSEVSIVAIEKLSRDMTPAMAEVCRSDLLAFARERTRAIVSYGYPSSLLFERRSKAGAERYLDSKCPIGPYLALRSSVMEGAEAIRRANGSLPILAIH